MHILNFVWFLIICLFLSSCGSKKTGPIDSLQSYCLKNQVKNQFIAHWEDQSATLIETDNAENFLAEYGDRLKFIEPNYKLFQQIPAPEEPTPPIEPIPIPWPQPEPQPTPQPAPPPEFFWNSDYILEEIGAYRSWSRGFKGQNVLVAIIDSGVDIQAPELRDNLYLNEGETLNGLDDDGNGYVDDLQGWNFSLNSRKIVDEIGHGTSIAGIITGKRMLGQSLGIAPDAKLLPLDIMSGSGGTEYDAKRAVEYAIKSNVKIINNSWSISCSQYLASAFDAYRSTNVIFVNSAGNTALDVFKNKIMLASLEFSNFLNVGSTDLFGTRSDFSGYGQSINIWAPGEKIPVLTLAIEVDSTTKASGTSVSAAVVSGAAALVWSAYPQKTAAEIVKRLQQKAIHRNGQNFISIDRALP